MQTACNRKTTRFARLDRREVVADFGGGAMMSDVGALLLSATDRLIGLVERFAACFTDGRAPGASSMMSRRWSVSGCSASRSATRI